MIYRKYLKRLFDIIGSCILLAILSPILFIIGVAVKVKLGSPVIYVQERPGYQEKIFKLYKFRSMKEAKDKEGRDLSDAERLIAFGKKLRASSLDELPELVNILRGDMSFVGPRPLLVEYLPLYNEVQKKRHDVRPGLTGLAQVNGRNTLSWEDKFKLDVMYVDTISFINDLIIVFQTIIKTIRREGVSPENSVTMDYFKGSEKHNVNEH